MGFLIVGHLDVAALENAINTFVRRHLSLRCSIFPNLAIRRNERDSMLRTFGRTGLFEPGMYLLSVIDDVHVSIQVVDLPGNEYHDKAIASFLDREDGHEIDCRDPPLLRASLLRLEDHKHVLALTVPQVICDSFSLRIIHREISLLYEISLLGLAAPPSVPISFVDFAVWQAKRLYTSHFSPHLDYWRQQWSDFGSDRIGAWHLPFTQRRRVSQENSSESVRSVFTEEESRRVLEFIRHSQLRSEVVFVAAYVLLLAHYTDKRRIAIPWQFSNRTYPELEHAVGWFANTHLLGFCCPNTISTNEFLIYVDTVIANASRYQGMPITHLWRTLRCHPRVSATIVLDVQIDDLTREVAPPSDARMIFEPTWVPLISRPYQPNLGIQIGNNRQNLLVNAQYDTGLFTGSAVSEMIGDLKMLVQTLVTDPTLLLANIYKLVKHQPGRNNPAPGVMSDFLVVGSDLLPTLPKTIHDSKADRGKGQSHAPRDT